MAIHLRQICLVAQSVASSVDLLSDILGIESCYVDPAVGKFGLENSLLAVGHRFIEVVAPLRDGTAAGRYLARRGGDGGYMVICQALSRAEQDQVRQNATDHQVRVAYESERGNWNIMQLHPGDMGAAFLEIEWDEQADTRGNWHPAGGQGWQDKVRTDTVSDIVAVELQAADPRRLAERWSAVTGCPLEHADGVAQIAMADAHIRFVEATDGRGDGLGGLDLRVVDRQRILDRARERECLINDGQVLICGTRLNLLD